MGSPLVTIVIPTFNDEPRHLAEAVKSAQAQTYPNVQIIVVDDGSDVPVALHGLEVISQANAGVSVARNRGIEAAAGEFIVALDGDDRLSSNYVREAASVLQSDSAARIAYPRVHEFGDAKGLYWPGAGRHVYLKEFAVHSPITVTSAFRRADWETVGGYDESLTTGHEDYEYWVRLLGQCGGYAASMPTAIHHYRVRSGSRSRTRWVEARLNTRTAISKAASHETLKALWSGSLEYVDALEQQLDIHKHDPFNPRSWPHYQRRLVNRVRRTLRQSRR